MFPRGFALALSCLFALAAFAAEPVRNLAVEKLCGAVSPCGTAPAERRVALVIGNAAYPGAGALKNPANDARDIAARLKRLGFEVIVRTDVRQKEMLRSLTEFGDKVQAGTEALFFYAGHGMQVRGKNYLIPIDAEIRGESSVSSEAVDVDQLLDKLAPARLSLVILDACRNNPFERRFRGGGQGLAQINAPTGTLIAYATAPGKVAADGDGRNGLYTAELLAAMDVPDIRIEDVFKRVRANVVRKSNEAQTPWESSSLTGDFYFNASGAQVAQLTPQLAGARTAAQIEDELWDAIKNSEKASVFEEYIRQYSNGRYLAQAHVKLAGLRDTTRPVTPVTTSTTGQMIKDCAECPDMVVLPPGSFQMGGNSYKDWGKPVHDVTISRAFALGKTEVTQGQWMAIMGSNPSGFKDYGDDFPVEKISWHEAKEFLRKLSARTGKAYRLPSEAEWEYACRAGGNHEYCGSQGIEAVAWYTNNAGGAAHAVAGKQPNAFGLYDMSGNALEWVEDCWNDSYNGAPADGSAWKSGDCSNRVLRGGSWNDGQEFVRSAARTIYPSTSRVFGISGLRVARELSERKEIEPAPHLSQSPDISGIWHWSVRSFLVPDRTNTVNADGTCLLNTGTTCIWTWEDAGKRKIAFRFSDTWTHMMTLAEDGRSMTGKDDWGTAVTAKRAGGK